MFDSIGTPRSLLTGFYSYPGEFVSGINEVISIQEGGVSILLVVFFVSIVLFVVFNFNKSD